MRFDPFPIHQTQPCSTSCVPTCIAIAFGMNARTVVEQMESLGFDIKQGVSIRQLDFYLSVYGVGSIRFLNRGLGLGDGYYLADVPSLGKLGGVHCVLLVIKDCEVTVFDPNKGRINAKVYSTRQFETMPISSLTLLDDFGDLYDQRRRVEPILETKEKAR